MIGTCIEKALSWGDEDLCLEFKFIQWSLCVLGSVGLNNITAIIGYHMVKCQMYCIAVFIVILEVMGSQWSLFKWECSLS